MIKKEKETVDNLIEKVLSLQIKLSHFQDSMEDFDACLATIKNREQREALQTYYFAGVKYKFPHREMVDLSDALTSVFPLVKN